MIISRTPLRISFLGGGTDYPAYFRRHGGATLATSINQYTYVTVSSLTPFFNHNIGVHYSNVERVKSLDEIQHPSVRETLRYMNIDGGIEIHIATDLPARTGLGSSSSFTVGLLKALNRFLDIPETTNLEIAEMAVHIEQEMIKERVGSQDQYACALGGLNLFRFHPDGSVDAVPVEIPRQRFNQLQGNLMMFYTGMQRHAHEIVAEQLEKTRKGVCDDVLNSMTKLVDRGVAILSDEQADLDEFGHLLHENWTLKQQCSSQVSNSAIDTWYSMALDAGALGGKLLGAGGGGFLLMYAEREQQDKVREALADLKQVPFEFEDFGSRIIFNNRSSRNP
jgi:D-glycero-alpha-D-manno-heptose-7-phosphate kinase